MVNETFGHPQQSRPGRWCLRRSGRVVLLPPLWQPQRTVTTCTLLGLVLRCELGRRPSPAVRSYSLAMLICNRAVLAGRDALQCEFVLARRNARQCSLWRSTNPCGVACCRCHSNRVPASPVVLGDARRQGAVGRLVMSPSRQAGSRSHTEEDQLAPFGGSLQSPPANTTRICSCNDQLLVKNDQP